MDVMGVINLNEADDCLQEITQHRPLAAVPFGGRYRLIDFVLSNMVNSGIHNVGIFVQHKYRSLMDHLRSGKEWDLARKRDGLVILPPAYVSSPLRVQRGDVENFYSNLDYINKSSQKYVLVAGINMICNLDYSAALEFHHHRQADVTVLFTEVDCTREDCRNAVMLEVSPDGRVSDMQVNPEKRKDRKISMEMFIMEKALFIDLIDGCYSRGDYDFIKHCLIKNLPKLKVFAYPHRGYLARVNSLASYFSCNLDLLQPPVWQELFSQSGLIYTKVKDEPPARYTSTSRVTNSLVAGGCYIEGTVENSILFRGVRVHKDVHIKNCIIMQKSEIAGNTILDTVICDKDVHITGKQLKGDVLYPTVVKKGTVL